MIHYKCSCSWTVDQLDANPAGAVTHLIESQYTLWTLDTCNIVNNFDPPHCEHNKMNLQAM